MVVLTALAGLAVLIAGLAGSVPAPQAVAVAVAVPSAHCGALLIRRGRRVEPSTGRRCRPTVLLGVGIAIGAASTAGAGLAHRFAPDAMAADVPLPAEIPLVGLFFTAGTYLLGLLLLPGAAPTLVGRLRRCLDAVGIGPCAFFIAWLLLSRTPGCAAPA